MPEIWTGFYLGVNGGYGWSANDSKLSATANGFGICPGNEEVCVPPPATELGAKAFGAPGGFGGGQIGYNLQRGSLVLGIEADIQAAAIDGGSTLSLATVSASATGRNELDWFGTARGRIGYAAGPPSFTSPAAWRLAVSMTV